MQYVVMVLMVLVEAEYMLTLCAGLMHVQATSSRGRRVSSAQAFLQPASHRSNLHIATHSHVHRVSSVVTYIRLRALA